MVDPRLRKQHSSLTVSPEANSSLIAAFLCHTLSYDCQRESQIFCIHVHKQIVASHSSPLKSGGC